jgi:hypothetical protein
MHGRLQKGRLRQGSARQRPVSPPITRSLQATARSWPTAFSAANPVSPLVCRVHPIRRCVIRTGRRAAETAPPRSSQCAGRCTTGRRPCPCTTTRSRTAGTAPGQSHGPGCRTPDSGRTPATAGTGASPSWSSRLWASQGSPGVWEMFPAHVGSVFYQKYHDAMREQKTTSPETPPTNKLTIASEDRCVRIDVRRSTVGVKPRSAR